jgi:hypothetical protein
MNGRYFNNSSVNGIRSRHRRNDVVLIVTYSTGWGATGNYKTTNANTAILILMLIAALLTYDDTIVCCEPPISQTLIESTVMLVKTWYLPLVADLTSSTIVSECESLHLPREEDILSLPTPTVDHLQAKITLKSQTHNAANEYLTLTYSWRYDVTCSIHASFSY